MLRYKMDFKRRRKTDLDRRTALGASLVASLRRSLMDRQVPLWLRTDFRELLVTDGRVSGVRVERDGELIDLHASRGVILGSGGFEHNQALRERYLPKPTSAAWSATPPGANTGAALEAALAEGPLPI